LHLRQLDLEDGRLLFDLDSDPEVMRFISKGQPTSLALIETVLLPRMLASYRPWPPRGFWPAHLRTNDQFIGWFHLRPDRLDPGEMELGFRLKREAWGRGLATEGARALVELALGRWGYDKVCARTLATNRASQRVMQKAGLSFESEFMYGADVCPEWTEAERRAVKYSLNRHEFDARPSVAE
jgi:RimJ/RimL family protein N-acetyltransferase